jgi:hypothetical protein
MVQNMLGITNPRTLSYAAQQNFEHLFSQLNIKLPEIAAAFGENSAFIGTVGAEVTRLTEQGESLLAAINEISLHIGGENDPYVNIDDAVEDGTSYQRPAASYLDASGRVIYLRKPTLDVPAGDVYDTTNNDGDDILETGTRAFVNPNYTDASRRPTTLRRIVGAVDIDVDDIFDTTREDLDNITDGSSYIRFAAAYGDGSGRPLKLRRALGGVDVDADDLFDTTVEDLDNVTDGSTFKKVAGVDSSNKCGASSYGADTVNYSAIVDNGVTGRLFYQDVVDEYQTMGSTLSDSQWDELEV